MIEISIARVLRILSIILRCLPVVLSLLPDVLRGVTQVEQHFPLIKSGGSNFEFSQSCFDPAQLSLEFIDLAAQFQSLFFAFGEQSGQFVVFSLHALYLAVAQVDDK